MFKIGDKVVYPMHGAGVIEAIEEKEILGERHQYYVLRLPIGNMKVMVPTSSGEGIGLRQVIGMEEVQEVFGILKSNSTQMPGNWNRRYRANLEKIKSGNIYEVAEVVRNLARREREKGLSSGEKRMLDSARQILISELVLATELEEDKARTILDQMLA
ncbi:MAG: CarD family transcriptional regulator [Thermoanaerobacterales bacterium]|nr:CarD family transcriptional regulator [Bacillota bacterium]MDI6907548.1 CarD family transcriptional regulator [Thermoanaerobacterales bacterium]